MRSPASVRNPFGLEPEEAGQDGPPNYYCHEHLVIPLSFSMRFPASCLRRRALVREVCGEAHCCGFNRQAKQNHIPVSFRLICGLPASAPLVARIRFPTRLRQRSGLSPLRRIQALFVLPLSLRFIVMPSHSGLVRRFERRRILQTTTQTFAHLAGTIPYGIHRP
jgi:hypothetical protein